MKDIKLKGYLYSNDDADIMRWWGWLDVCCPLDIENGLREAEGDEITLFINSAGGNYLAGAEIYGLLKAYPGRSRAVIQSHSASASTIAMLGCDEIVAEAPALICVHNPSARVDGEAEAHRITAEELDNIKAGIIGSYMQRVKIEREELSALMDKSEWINARQALDMGLIDSVNGDPGEAAIIINAIGDGYMLPTAKMREQYLAAKKPPQEAAQITEAKRTSARLEVLSKF